MIPTLIFIACLAFWLGSWCSWAMEKSDNDLCEAIAGTTFVLVIIATIITLVLTVLIALGVLAR